MKRILIKDKKSMLSEKSIQAYKKINAKFQLRNPDFKTYGKFKYEIKNWRLI